MIRSLSRFWTLGLLTGLLATAAVWAQQGTDPGQPPPPPDPQAAPQPGVDVQARGPVHEAFAAPATQPEPTILVPKKPPEPINEMPPDTKPDGNMVWIGGYWAWDDDRKDFLWVSGIWRSIPPGKQWVPGYWRQQSEQWQWVPGFWNAAAVQTAAAAPQQQVTYLPAPPTPPQVAPPGEPPNANSFYVPGSWSWDGARYGWRAGYWAQVQPGYVWVSAHYRWTPSGYIYVPGYWDYALETRGVLFAPVVVSPVVIGPAFVYRPVYVVPHAVVVDAFFIRPAYCHYYFGDYYGPAYRRWGFESCVVYSRRSYDPVFTYVVWQHRAEPRWREAQINITFNRYSGVAPRPARTINITRVTNVTTVNHITTFKQYAAVHNIQTVRLNNAQVVRAREQSVAMRQSAVVRNRSEARLPSGASLTRPHTATLSAPSLHPVGPAPTARSLNTAGRATPAGRANPYTPNAGRQNYNNPGRAGYPGANRQPNGLRSGPWNQQRPQQRQGLQHPMQKERERERPARREDR